MPTLSFSDDESLHNREPLCNTAKVECLVRILQGIVTLMSQKPEILDGMCRLAQDEIQQAIDVLLEIIVECRLEIPHLLTILVQEQ